MGEIKLTSTFEDGESNSAIGNIEDPPIILEAYWTDEKGDPVNFLEYNKKAYVNVKSKNIKDEEITLRVYEKDSQGFDDDIHTKVYTTKYDIFKMSFDVTPAMFREGEESLLHFYFSLQIESQEVIKFCESGGKYLKIHFVRYVPGTMKSLGWDKGAALQEEWFSRLPTEDIDEKPNFSIITMDWVLGFNVTNDIYKLMISEKIWINTAGKISLLKQIGKMILDGKIKLPVEEGDSETFGDFRKKLIDHKGINVPIFDKYHHQERSYDPSLYKSIMRPLDDLTAALARFVFRLSVGGVITRKKDNYSITINKVGIYVRDSFDFIDSGWSSQDLGYWNFEKNIVLKQEPQQFDLPGFKFIENSDYQDYQEISGKGGDFRLYSDIKYTDTSDSFDLPLHESYKLFLK